MIARWLPWKFVIKRAAKRYGFIDPINLAARVRRFAQPSEVQEPIELLRAGILFHARGLINTRAIQYNLDWVWPYWVEKQFNPDDFSFIPRAFSFSHVNLTHRNWTAVGRPEVPLYPIVDPRGMFTPLYDGWSLDCWIISKKGEFFLPSRVESAEQFLVTHPGLEVDTRCGEGGFSIVTRSSMDVVNGAYHAILDIMAGAVNPGWLVVAVRPYNPEGIQFIENIEFQESVRPFLLVNRHTRIYMDQNPVKVVFSNYAEGDVLHKWNTAGSIRKVRCSVGMATAAAFFDLSGSPRRVRVSVDLSQDLTSRVKRPRPVASAWGSYLEGLAELSVPDRRIRQLYDIALRTLIILSAGDVVPGPYTYRRFWFRDACLMLNSLMAINAMDRSRRRIDTFPGRQKLDGYFRSQEGEWDSNGQVLWVMDRYLSLSGASPPRKWLEAIFKGAHWIQKKRIAGRPGLRHGGLLPAGFSAEHLGPNDYYYWDDFWGWAGLRVAAGIARKFDSRQLGERFARYADDFGRTIFHTIANIPESKSRGCIPASPYRRMDAGSVGSLVADYPLQLTPPGDTRIMNTVEFLLEHCFFKGAFFQDMIHSGINAYLTLDIAQSLLRNGDPRYRDLVETVSLLASPTGLWPEAIHPLTGGGCMGDGQHGWAASEWVMMIRNLFVREEENSLIIGSGVFPRWLETGEELRFGPTPTPYGPVSVNIREKGDAATVMLDNRWRSEPPDQIKIRLPGYPAHTFVDSRSEKLQVEVQKK